MKAGLLACLVVVAMAFGLAVGVGFGTQRIATGINGSVVLGVVSLTATMWFGLWQFEKTKRKEAEARIFSQRAEIYHRLVIVLRNIMLRSKGWYPERGETDDARDLTEITYDMIVWGGQNTIRQIMNMGDHATDDIGKQMRRASDLFRAIRQDLGHNDDDQLPEDIVLTMIIADEREDIRSKMRAAI